MEVVADPDEIVQKELTVYIYTSLQPKGAIERLDKLDESWWLDASTVSGSKQLIQVEYE